MQDKRRVESHEDLDVYQLAFSAAMRCFAYRDEAAFVSKLTEAEAEAAKRRPGFNSQSTANTCWTIPDKSFVHIMTRSSGNS